MSEVSDELPPSWAWKTVAEIGDVGLGRQRSPNNHAGPHMRRYVRAANITWNGWDLSDVKEMNFNPADFHRFQLRVGDVLLNEGSGSAKEVGKPAIWRGEIEDCCFQNTLVRVQPIGCSSEYLYYYFRWLALSGGVAPETQGVNIHHIGRAGVANCRLPVAPLAEQCRIVARIEALFARTRRARADLKRIAPLSLRYEQAVRNDVLQAGQDAGWPVRSLGEVASEVRNGIAAKPSDQPPGTRILRISAVRQGRVSLDDVRYHQASHDTNTGPYLLRNRDLLFIRFNGNAHLVAACGLVRDLEGECVYPDKLIRMRMDQRLAVPEYIEMAAGSGIAREQLANHIKTAAGQHGISGGDLKTLMLPMPDLATQETIAAWVASKHNSCLVANREATRALALLDRLEQSILARAFRGELVPQNPSEAAASLIHSGTEAPARARRRQAA